MRDEVAQQIMVKCHGVTPTMIRTALVVAGALLVGGVDATTASPAGEARVLE